ncbi:GAF domain-containing sensor histidine kinase [Pedococcus soli]
MTTLEQDHARVAELANYKVIEQPARSDLVAVVEVAAQMADMPMAAINLFTDIEEHPVATHGYAAGSGARENSMCNVLLDLEHPVVVPDASKDERFKNSPNVDGTTGAVRFYAAHPLITPQGVTIGALCVFDTKPRTMSGEQAQALGGLAERVVDLLELDLRTRRLSETVAELESAQAELRRSNERLTAFAGQVSHDLRNPLTAVSMALRMIDEAIGSDGLAGDALQDIGWLLHRAISGSNRMKRLIDDLLAFARLGGELVRVPVDLSAVARGVVEDLAVALMGATVEVRDLPRVTGDPVQLGAVVQNLVANAAKFTRPGEKANVEVAAHRIAGGWRVEVSDRGPGIAEADRERVFEPLARVDPDVEGSGIGLTTCRRIVEAHGGRIGVKPSPWGGTTAWFELPD